MNQESENKMLDFFEGTWWCAFLYGLGLLGVKVLERIVVHDS